MDVDSVTLLSYLTEGDLTKEQLQQVNNYVTERIQEFRGADTISEDILIKAKGLVQIAQNINPTDENEQIVIRITQFVIQMQTAGLLSENTPIQMQERFYGLFLLTTNFLKLRFPRVYLNYQMEIAGEILNLQEKIRNNPDFTATIRTVLNEIETADAPIVERAVSLWI